MGSREGFLKMGEMTAPLYAARLDPVERKTDDAGGKEKTAEGCPWQGERGDGAQVEGALARSMDIHLE